MDAFYTISQMTTGERVIEKSRFIGIAVPLANLEEIEKTRREIRETYPNARHYVYAYRLHEGLLEKSSDDGEPQGTGGRPILDLLQHRNIWNILLVVVRYFGGVLLGTGGLARAYGGVARQVIMGSELKELVRYSVGKLAVPYAWFEPLKYQLAEHNWRSGEEEFADVVKLTVYILEKEAEFFLRWLENFTQRQVTCELLGVVWA